MGIFSSIFGSKSDSAALKRADQAIQLGRARKIAPAEMLSELLQGRSSFPWRALQSSTVIAS
jgi:hypothetical protein